MGDSSFSDSRTSAAVEKPVVVFLGGLIPIFSKRIALSCLGELRLNVSPAMWIDLFFEIFNCSFKFSDIFSSFCTSTKMPCRSICMRMGISGISICLKTIESCNAFQVLFQNAFSAAECSRHLRSNRRVILSRGTSSIVICFFPLPIRSSMGILTLPNFSKESSSRLCLCVCGLIR